jgi:hypothetical protein
VIGILVAAGNVEIMSWTRYGCKAKVWVWSNSWDLTRPGARTGSWILDWTRSVAWTIEQPWGSSWSNSGVWSRKIPRS